MYIVKKVTGLWRVLLQSNSLPQFSSASRKSCTDWIANNTQPQPAAYRLNSTAGVSVWRPRG